MTELLQVSEMAEADQRTIDAGTPGLVLMKNAGQAIFEVIRQRWTPRPVLVVCGPGNNGGDGFVVATALRAENWPVQLASLVPVDKLDGDARAVAEGWGGEVGAFNDIDWQAPDLIVDAIFGAGLSRPIEGDLARIVSRINNCGVPVVAVDMPSGVDGDSGEICGTAVEADHTVTFFRAKPGHYLHPGKEHCGDVHVRDIGIYEDVLAEISPQTSLNGPRLWGEVLPLPDHNGHKYSRGAACVCSGGPFTSGAARLAATAALRSGAGIVTVLSPGDAMQVNACHLTEVMLRRADNGEAVRQALEDDRVRGIALGPGAGTGAGTRDKVLAAMCGSAGAVIDADGLTSFEDCRQELFDALRPGDVLTPHEGEFRRLFGSDRLSGSKLAATRAAAAEAGAIVLLKGDDTVVAAPDGRAAINATGSPWLATAGSGDVLTGIITGLIAQGMPGFEAACAAAWLHGKCGEMAGPGTIAGDLSSVLPFVLEALYTEL